MTRCEVPALVSALLDGREARWADPARAAGYYDGIERTLEVFDVEAREQRALFRRLRQVRDEVDEAAGGAVVFIFYTRTQSAKIRVHEALV